MAANEASGAGVWAGGAEAGNRDQESPKASAREGASDNLC